MSEFQTLVRAIEANRKHRVQVTEEFFDEFLGAVPPLAIDNRGFVSSEPHHHNNQGIPYYYAFIERDGNFYGCLCSLDEFLADQIMLRDLLVLEEIEY